MNAPAKAELLIFSDYTPGGTYDKSTASSACTLTRSGSSYTGTIANIPAKHMRKQYYARIYVVTGDGEELYSDLLYYDIATYAHTVINGNHTAHAKALVDRMMRYGDSSARYFDTAND